MNERHEQIEHPYRAIAVHVDRYSIAGPYLVWHVHHPDGYLIEVGSDEARAVQIAREINAGRLALAAEREGRR